MTANSYFSAANMRLIRQALLLIPSKMEDVVIDLVNKAQTVKKI